MSNTSDETIYSRVQITLEDGRMLEFICPHGTSHGIGPVAAEILEAKQEGRRWSTVRVSNVRVFARLLAAEEVARLREEFLERTANIKRT